MIEGVGSEYMELEVLEDVLIAVTGMLTGAKVNLGKADISPGRETTLAELDAADYTGNGAEVITWDAPSISDDGKVEVVGDVGEFRPTDDVTPNSIYTWFVQDAANNLLDCGRFPTAPLNMEDALHAVRLAVKFRPGTCKCGVELVS